MMHTEQTTPVAQDKDVIELTCVATGVGIHDIKFYRWLIPDTNELLFTYPSKAYPKPRTKASVIHEEHIFSADRITSRLYIIANVNDMTSYRCMVYTKKKELCRKDKHVRIASK